MGLQHLLVAPVGTSWDGSRINPDSPPSGFVHLGAVEESSPALRIDRRHLRIMSGFPEAVIYDQVVAVSGQISATLLSYVNEKLRFMVGANSMASGGGYTDLEPEAIGTAYYRVLAVADLLNNGQVVWDFRAATPTGEWVEQIRTGTEARMPFSFDLFAGYDSTLGRPTLGRRRVFTANTIA